MKNLKCLCLLLLSPILLAGCSPANTPPPATPIPSTSTPAEPTATSAPEGPALYYEGSAQFELISPQGVRVMINVLDPSKLTSPPTANDVLLSSHKRDDRYVPGFAEAFPGQTMVLKTGELNIQDVSIKAILSAGVGAFSAPKDQVPDGNTIYIIDIGGLRVADFGDIAQPQFTPEQLAALQNVDIAITVLVGHYGDMTMENKNGFNLMDQIKPKLIIPNYDISLEGIQYAAGKWSGYALNGPLHITRAKLPTGTKLLVMGMMADTYKSLCNLQDW
jgi:hypothetical protein